MWFPGKYFLIERKRRTLLKHVAAGPLKSCLQTPLPRPEKSVRESEFLALDFETTGLDRHHDAILSIGYCLVRQGRIPLADRGHHMIRINKPVPPASVVIHKITDDRMQQGEPLHQVMPLLLEKMAGRILLVHFRRIEQGFFAAACRQLYGQAVPALYVDTLEIEKRRLQTVQPEVVPHHLRLFNARQRYRLPRYHAHNALEDAIATAELFLAQVATGGGLDSPVKRWL